MTVAGCLSWRRTAPATGLPFGMMTVPRPSQRTSDPAVCAGSGRRPPAFIPRCCGPGCGWSAATTSPSPRRCCSRGRAAQANPRRWPERGPGCAGRRPRRSRGGRPAAPSRPGQDALFDPADPDFPDPGAALDAVIEVHADQQRRIAADEHPGRFALLVAAESACGLIAAEMAFDGLPWRADVHDELLTELLGPRPVSGMRLAKAADLAARISGALGRPVNPDSPAQVALRALAANGVRVPSTRSGVLRGVDHPAAPLLLEYKSSPGCTRRTAGPGWTRGGVAGGRFRAEYRVLGSKPL